MKILFDSHVPFSLAHGGAQIQIEQTHAALQKAGVDADFLRWWDEHQAGDILHYFGRIPMDLLHAARRKGLKVVSSVFLSGLAARSDRARAVQKLALRVLRPLAPAGLRDAFSWNSYDLSDVCVAMTPREAAIIREMFQTPAERIRVVPNGVEDVFLNEPPAARGPWLVCTATIVEMKQVLKLAQMAVAAQTPVWIIGKPYAESDEYARRFFAYARQNAALVRYEGAVNDRRQLARIYREARGFVLLSRWESLSLSALEAAACECPLLLSDLPWARTTFGDRASYCPPFQSVSATSPVLRAFYAAAPGLKAPPRPMSWMDVAEQLKSLYAGILASP